MILNICWSWFLRSTSSTIFCSEATFLILWALWVRHTIPSTAPRMTLMMLKIMMLLMKMIWIALKRGRFDQMNQTQMNLILDTWSLLWSRLPLSYLDIHPQGTSAWVWINVIISINIYIIIKINRINCFIFKLNFIMRYYKYLLQSHNTRLFPHLNQATFSKIYISRQKCRQI